MAKNTYTEKDVQQALADVDNGVSTRKAAKRAGVSHDQP